MFNEETSRRRSASATTFMRTSGDVAARCLRDYLQEHGWDPAQVVVGDLLPDELLYEGVVLMPDEHVFEFVLGVVESHLQRTHPRPAQIAKWNDITASWKETQWSGSVRAAHWLRAQET
jgi:hypothetical protein